INGLNAFANQTFPGTGAWSTYSTISVSHTFPLGTSTISLIYNSALGNANYLNIDNLTIPTLVPAAPGPLLISAQPPNLTLSWSTPGLLQSAPAVLGPWVDVTGNPSSPATFFPADLTGANRFYRLRR